MSIKVQGINKAIKQLEKYSDEVRRDVVLAMDETMINVHREAQFNAPVDEARLKSSIHISHPTQQKLHSMVYVNANYAPYVEFGTKGNADIPQGLERYAMQFRGKGGGSFAELEERISKWAKRKGIEQNRVWYIAMNIARFGKKAQPFLFPAWEKERPRLMKALTKLLKR